MQPGPAPGTQKSLKLRFHPAIRNLSCSKRAAIAPKTRLSKRRLRLATRFLPVPPLRCSTQPRASSWRVPRCRPSVGTSWLWASMRARRIAPSGILPKWLIRHSSSITVRSSSGPRVVLVRSTGRSSVGASGRVAAGWSTSVSWIVGLSAGLPRRIGPWFPVHDDTPARATRAAGETPNHGRERSMNVDRGGARSSIIAGVDLPSARPREAVWRGCWCVITGGIAVGGGAGCAGAPSPTRIVIIERVRARSCTSPG